MPKLLVSGATSVLLCKPNNHWTCYKRGQRRWRKENERKERKRGRGASNNSCRENLGKENIPIRTSKNGVSKSPTSVFTSTKELYNSIVQFQVLFPKDAWSRGENDGERELSTSVVWLSAAVGWSRVGGTWCWGKAMGQRMERMWTGEGAGGGVIQA